MRKVWLQQLGRAVKALASRRAKAGAPLKGWPSSGYPGEVKQLEWALDLGQALKRSMNP